MPALQLAGPSNQPRSLLPDAERTVNWYPQPIEATGKGGSTFYLKQVPGLTKVVNALGSVSAMTVARQKLYVVAAGKLYLIGSDWSATLLGYVSLQAYFTAVNNTQIALASVDSLSVWDLDSSSMSHVTNNFSGCTGFDNLDGFGVFSEPNSATFFITANQDFTSIEALDFATAEGSNGNIVGLIVKNREVHFLKEATTEIWYDSGQAFPLIRNDGANIETGLAAQRTLCKSGGVAFWLGKDAGGSSIVFAMSAYSPQRISTHALEEALRGVGDVSVATAFVYHQDGSTFYVLNVPGLTTTWVYDVGTQLWHERAELVNGVYSQWRPTAHAFCYGFNLVSDSLGNIYKLDPTVNTNAGDVIARDRITPHQSIPGLTRTRFGSIQIDCEVGQGLSGVNAQLMLRYSDNGAKSWSNWRLMSLGNIGEFMTRCRATMLGSARDRVWHLRVTDNVRCDVRAAIVNEI